MKKIFAIILVLACMLSVFACGKIDEVDAVIEMFESTEPTKATTTVTQTAGNIDITSTMVLTTGTVGGRAVSLYEGKYQQLAEVSNSLSTVSEESETMWYVEGRGVGTWNKDTEVFDWDEAGVDFAPEAGFIKLNLSKNTINSYTYDAATETLVMNIKAENATEVVKDYLDDEQTINSDLTVTVVTTAGRIASITIAYFIPAHDVQVGETDATVTVPDTDVVIKTVYEYDLQQITLIP